jgi:hypothetical protein
MSRDRVLDEYRLTGLPFELGRYDVKRIGRDDEWSRLLQIMTSARASRSPITGILLGTYGSGKSFMLWQLAQELNPPLKSKVLCSGPIRLIDPEQRRDFTKSLVLRFFSRGVDQETELIPILRAADYSPSDAPSHLRPFVALLLALTRKSGAAAARRVLAGGRALRKEAEDAGFPEIAQIRTNDDAISLLQALQLIAKTAKVDAISLLIDEVEYIDALPKGQRSAVLDSIKHLWDQEVDFFSRGNDAAQIAMILAATPTFWHKLTRQLLSEAEHGDAAVGVYPFVSRIPKDCIVEMTAELAADEARQLIVSRMSEARAGQGKDGIIPFTDAYVSYVYDLSEGLPRKIIEICGVVLAEAAKKKLKEIDRSAAKKILRDLLISYEPRTKRE